MSRARAAVFIRKLTRVLLPRMKSSVHKSSTSSLQREITTILEQCLRLVYGTDFKTHLKIFSKVALDA